MASPGNHGERISLFSGRKVGSDLVKSNELGGIGAPILLTANVSITVVPYLDAELWRTAGTELTGIDFQGTEFGFAQNSTVVAISIFIAAVHAYIVGEAEKIRKLVRHQGDIPLWEEGIFEGFTGLDGRGIFGR